ncbi:MAG: glycosyltransferase family 1 protein [Sphingobacteriales bacterium]|nr:MAG: glycosyltransferase family 1 protein [Sphingobacteriales bacterium]
MSRKVIYIISDIDRALAFEWLAEQLDPSRIKAEFILLNPGPSVLEDYLTRNHFPVTRFTVGGKKDWLKTIIRLYLYLRKAGPAIVHCHLLQACILGLTAARSAGIKVRIHTRHHSSLHHVYFRKGIFWDRWNNNMSTHIVAISASVMKILVDWEHVPVEKTRLVPHGFLLEKFETSNEDMLTDLRLKYDLAGKGPVVGVVSRLTEWKGVQYIIPAFQEFLMFHPQAVLMLFNAEGEYKDAIQEQLKAIPGDSIRMISFEPNMAEAYQLLDMFVHVPIDDHSEAFGQVYIEAFASGVPMVATKSGIGNDILLHRENAIVVEYRSSRAIFEGMECLTKDLPLREQIVLNAKKAARQFSLNNMIKDLTTLYESA